MKNKVIYALTLASCHFLCVCLLFSSVLAAEPRMADYTHTPNFMVESVKPNILVILDNSGSMNHNAYGAATSNGSLVGDSYFGAPYQNANLISNNDAEEDNNRTRTTHVDLDLGWYLGSSTPDTVGVRFDGLYVPQGAVITSAYIAFTATGDNASTAETTAFDIRGEDTNDSPVFVDGDSNSDITRRNLTSSVAYWKTGPWTAETVYRTPDLSAIVQEIVGRADWKEGNALSFVLEGSTAVPLSGRSAYSYEGSSSKAPRLVVEVAQSSAKDYYGYFNSDYFYANTGTFVHRYKKINYVAAGAGAGYWNVETLSGASTTLSNDRIRSEGLYDGNWMNWMTMRRIDVLRKVLMGGLATSRTGGGNQTIYGESPPSSQSARYFDREFYASLSAVTPYVGTASDPVRYRVVQDDFIIDSTNDGSFSNSDTKHRIAIQKLQAYDPVSFGSDGNLSGVFQQYFSRARWGLEFFNRGDGNDGSGGSVVRAVEDGNIQDLLTQLQNKQCDTWTPLAESFYVAMQYFKQEDADSSLEYPNGAAPNSNDGDDPFKQDGDDVYCAKNFVLLLTDGASTKDSKIPSAYKDYDGDGDSTGCNEDNSSSTCDYLSGGTDYLDDIALYARTNDLRSDMADEQNILLYNVFALSDDDNARQLLMDASRNGGFEDFNGNGVPDGSYSDPPEDRLEWDRDGNAIPDTYFEATDGAKLQKELGRAIEDILRRAASGTAVSVISSSTEGEGNLVQAFFQPVVEEGDESVQWTGYLQSLWVDSRGNIREDTNENYKLDLSEDRIIKFRSENGQTVVDRYSVTDNQYPSLDSTTLVDFVVFDELPAIWNAGEKLSARDPVTRNIATFIDIDNDKIVDAGEVVPFFEGNATDISPYLGVSALDWNYLGDTPENRTTNLINFIRGQDSGFDGTYDIRNRTINNKTWRLGDIVYSSPVIVAAPTERYDQIYADESYMEYYNYYRNRETVVYAGSNDGMFHAFTSWYYDKANTEFTNELPQPDGSVAVTTDPIGSELWAYIPQSLLPHLKWLADPDYNHVHYADLTAKVFDAKILPDNTHYDDDDTDPNWGTFILLGLNYGGKHIWSTGDFDGDGTDETRHFYPTYTLIDVTEPRSPQLVWERTYSEPVNPTESANNDTDLGLTMQQPSITKVNDDWFAVFGSGPSDFDAESFRNGHVYVVNLATGEPYRNGTNDWLFETANPRAMMGGSASYDKNLNYSVDSIFIGESFDSNSGADLDWEGAMYKVRVPWNCDVASCAYYGDTVNGSYDSNPASWALSKIFTSPRPIVAAPSLSVDKKGNSWLYFGTGRYFTEDDKNSIETNYFIGLKDPFFNRELYGPDPGNETYYLNAVSAKTVLESDLFNANAYSLTSSGTVYNMPAGTLSDENFNSLVQMANEMDGWKRTLNNAAGERMLNKPVVIGGLALNTSFAPSINICSSGGSSYLYGIYYLTGTAFKSAVFNLAGDDGVDGTADDVESGSSDPDTLGSGDSAESRNVESIALGSGLSSAPTLHVGKQEDGDVTVLYQKSTGEVGQINVDPAINPRSSLKSWLEERGN